MAASPNSSSEEVYLDFKSALDTEEGDKAEKIGDGAQALGRADKQIEADYRAPYLAHATMEPMNCTVRIDQDRCDLWVGNQAPEMVRDVAAYYAEVHQDKVQVHSTFLGGGFGRRVSLDYVAEAVSIAKASGLAVQVVWSREDDIRHDYYRPASMARFKAALDEQGRIESWFVKRAGPNIMPYMIDDVFDTMVPGFVPDGLADWMSKRGYGLYDGILLDHASVEGLFEDYDIPNKEVRHITRDPGLRTGYWRSVGHSFGGFCKESFMDELALAADRDPVEMRLLHSQSDPNLHQVIEVAAEKSNWGQPLPTNHFHGIAAHTSFNSSVAQVAEISIERNQIKVHKVTCVVNCGTAINPDNVRAQMESGIIFGISAALFGVITLHNGQVEQSNFHDYPMVRMDDSPQIEVHIIESDEDPTGVGEPGVPPIAAAIGNAVYAATGKRLRQLPLKLS
ncbi:xanthine dehydrogenase family protein molybdopterin-binding subunit [Pseudomaricurvus alkylphenolicus]|uniref:xanthine dehydrogenase family protein molybdopterin-binding subunit n=1 Tax=Pseudomaricurvus alkylphenolicus TaxID=1306991 RepID=UPI00141F0792|nr:molybdopterin cofactor-binding domain-containing protein [Pseudomaricurvus alkylphenolicus]NIB42210.1 xanthine dehydrogenase family protein molybdopterin-binding subunit [Pseudomaricurvus alkylphenolicus]